MYSRKFFSPELLRRKSKNALQILGELRESSLSKCYHPNISLFLLYYTGCPKKIYQILRLNFRAVIKMLVFPDYIETCTNQLVPKC